MTLWSVISLIFGSLGVILTIKQRIWCWPFALIATLSSMVDFFEARLFGDMALQVFYFIAGVYGWIFWKQQQQQVFVVTHTPKKFISVLIIATIAQSVLYFFILNYFRGDVVLADAILTAASVTATYMMMRKWWQNWWCWIVIDLLYVILYLYKQMPLYAVLYLVFTAMSIYGVISWKKVLQTK